MRAVISQRVDERVERADSAERASKQTFHGLSVPVASPARPLTLTCQVGVQTGEGTEVATPGLYPRQLGQNENLHRRRHDAALPMCCCSWYVVHAHRL